jgi:poly(beta-D-mannuronate) lyase
VTLTIALLMTATYQHPTVVVADMRQLSEALKLARPGDTVLLKSGNWKDCRIVLDRGGVESRPIILRAEIPGQVHFTGQSSVVFSSPWVNLVGVGFDHGGVRSGSVVTFKSNHCTLADSSIIDYNPSSPNDASYWVMFQGSYNTVSRSLFKGKNNLQPLVGNALSGAKHNSVIGSVFEDIPYIPKTNGREIFRIWGFGKDGSVGNDGAFFTLDSNLFLHADGEGQEIVSLKSNFNIVSNNLIVASRGGITIRQGNDNRVLDNTILGEGVDRAYGIRITGQNQVVRGNYVENCKYGVLLMSGGPTPTSEPDTPIQGEDSNKRYRQIVNLRLEANTFVNNRKFDLGFGGDRQKNGPNPSDNLLPKHCRIEKNSIYSESSHDSVSWSGVEGQAEPDFRHLKNIFSGNILYGDGKIALEQARSGFAIRPYPIQAPVPVNMRAIVARKSAVTGPSWMKPITN